MDEPTIEQLFLPYKRQNHSLHYFKAIFLTTCNWSDLMKGVGHTICVQCSNVLFIKFLSNDHHVFNHLSYTYFNRGYTLVERDFMLLLVVCQGKCYSDVGLTSNWQVIRRLGWVITNRNSIPERTNLSLTLRNERAQDVGDISKPACEWYTEAGNKGRK